MVLKVATHNGIFHADEVTAIALLKLFTQKNILVTRLKHNTKEFRDFDMVIDISRKFDGMKYFDHHQYKGGKSSAGLVWEYLGIQEKYPQITKLVKMVDDNDVGITKAKPFEYSSLIKCFNSHDDIYGKEQDERFEKAVEFAYTILASMKNNEEELQKAKHIVNNSFFFNSNRHIIELERYTRFWSNYINGETTPDIKAVVWEDENDGTWKVKIPSKKLGSFELAAKSLPQDDSMEFVHSNGFFGVAKTREALANYLKRVVR